MDTDERIHIELLKRLKIFSEAYVTSRSNENTNESKKHSHEKTDKRHNRKFSPDIKKMKNMKITNIPKRRHFKSIVSTNFNGKNKSDENIRCVPQNKPIKINLVSQKFKIADDFNERNSIQFLIEKDECLKKIILTDEIEDGFFDENEKDSLFNLSIIKKNGVNNDLSNKVINKKIIIDDSIASLSKLIDEIK